MVRVIHHQNVPAWVATLPDPRMLSPCANSPFPLVDLVVLQWGHGAHLDGLTCAPVTRTEIACSLWLPFIVFAIYPALALVRGPLRRWRRRRRGMCLNCGYNLTGNVSGMCPECGEAV
jgi:hypothetical protein